MGREHKSGVGCRTVMESWRRRARPIGHSDSGPNRRSSDRIASAMARVLKNLLHALVATLRLHFIDRVLPRRPTPKLFGMRAIVLHGTFTAMFCFFRKFTIKRSSGPGPPTSSIVAARFIVRFIALSFGWHQLDHA